jgi:peptidoglycan hydrolase CwlO-like protein
MNKVIAYLQRAFEGRDLEKDADALEMKVEELKALIEHGGMITAAFAKKLEGAINSIRAGELLDTQLEQAKDESRSIALTPAEKKAAKQAASASNTTSSPRTPSQGSARPYGAAGAQGNYRTAYRF